MKKCEYISLGHVKTHLRYHLIFSTKYRKKCLNQIHDNVIAAFKKSELNSHYKILAIELDKDHIHLLITHNKILMGTKRRIFKNFLLQKENFMDTWIFL